MKNPSFAGLATVILLTLVALSGCATQSTFDRNCPEDFSNAALTVPDVLSAEFECGGTLNDQGVDGVIKLDVDTQEEANKVIEGIYRAFAADSRISNTIPSIRFVPERGDDWFHDSDLGFNGSPSIGDMREKYKITPTPTP